MDADAVNAVKSQHGHLPVDNFTYSISSNDTAPTDSEVVLRVVEYQGKNVPHEHVIINTGTSESVVQVEEFQGKGAPHVHVIVDKVSITKLEWVY